MGDNSLIIDNGVGKSLVTVNLSAQGVSYIFDTYDEDLQDGASSTAEIISLPDISVNFHRLLVVKGCVGAGKTLLLKSLAGVQEVSSGDISLSLTTSSSLTNVSKNCIDIDAYYVHSQPEFNFITSIVGDELDFVGIEPKELEEMGLGEYLEQNVNDLSGGELKRISILIAVKAQGDLLLLDEPIDMLDDRGCVEYAKFIYEQSAKKPIIVATHDDHFDEYADAIVQISSETVVDIDESCRLVNTKGQNANNINLNNVNLDDVELGDVELDVVELVDVELDDVELGDVELDGIVIDVNIPEGRVGEDETFADSSNGSYDDQLSTSLLSVVPHLKVEGLEVRIDGLDRQFPPLTVDLSAGEVVCIYGQNGVGKTLIMRELVGISKHSRSGGYEWFIERANRGGCLQFPEHMLYQDTIINEIKDIAGQDWVQEVVELLGWSKIVHRSPFSLSDGQKRKLVLLSTLVSKQSCIFDEPFAGLDTINKAELFHLFKHGSMQGKSVLYTANRLDDTKYADRVIKLT